VSTGDTGAARSDARSAVDAIAARVGAGDARIASTSQSSAMPRSRCRGRRRVIVGGLGLEAVVTSVHDGTADLDVRGKRMRASVRDLRVDRRPGAGGARQRQRGAAAARRPRPT
jgi:hypothetical protein